MKKYITIISVIACSLYIFSSCSDFLDKKPFASLSDNTVKENSSNAGYSLNGTYNTLQDYRYYGRNFVIFGDVTTENIILPSTNSGRFIAEAQWSLTANNGDLLLFWAYAYKALNQINSIIENINSQDSENQNLFIKANALGLRALIHFDLVRIFAQTYNGNQNLLGVPYMKSSIIYDKPERETVESNYSNILSDLNESISIYTQIKGEAVSSLNSLYVAPYYLNEWSVKALLAKVYMTQLNYTSAIPVLEDIINNSGYRILTNGEYADAWSRSYNNQSDVEFMFAIRNVSDDYGATNCLGYIFVQAGYGDLRVPDNFYELYAANDIRKQAFFANGTGNKADWIFVNKYPGRDGTTALSDIPIIRLSDIYLLYAEAQANSGTMSAAIEYLDIIRQRADAKAEATAASISKEDLINSILLERRKELAYEGQYFFDLKRLKMNIVSAYKEDYSNYATISYPDDMLAFPIPQSEIDANVNIKQNPGY